MKKVKLKSGNVVRIRGREDITEQNLTVELAESLIKENPNFADLFIFEEDKVKKNDTV